MVSFLDPKVNKAPPSVSVPSQREKKNSKSAAVFKLKSLYKAGKLSRKSIKNGFNRKSFLGRKSKVLAAEEEWSSTYLEKTVVKPPPTVD